MDSLDLAFTELIKIPALKVVYDPADEGFLRSLLTSQAGVKAGQPFYRRWIVAAYYLELSPAIHRVTKHDRTTLGNYAIPISFLKTMQATEDELNQVTGINPSIQSTAHYMTVAFRPRVEFYG